MQLEREDKKLKNYDKKEAAQALLVGDMEAKILDKIKF